MAIDQDRSVRFIRNPQLKNIELRFSFYRQHTFDKHIHDTYSIGIVHGGQTDFYHHNRTETIGQGEIALINPGEVHACNPQNGSLLSYYMLYIAPDLIHDTANDLSGKNEGLPHFSTPIIRDVSLYFHLIDLSLLIIKTEDPFDIETNLYESLSVIIQKYGNIKAQSKETRGTNKSTERGWSYLMENLFENVSLQELASYSGLSPFHFLREFRKRYGLPPHIYQLQRRVNAAKNLLADNKPIAQVATEVGFADQSHFTRKFRSLVGATPRQYQLASRLS